MDYCAEGTITSEPGQDEGDPAKVTFDLGEVFVCGSTLEHTPENDAAFKQDDTPTRFHGDFVSFVSGAAETSAAAAACPTEELERFSTAEYTDYVRGRLAEQLGIDESQVEVVAGEIGNTDDEAKAELSDQLDSYANRQATPINPTAPTRRSTSNTWAPAAARSRTRAGAPRAGRTSTTWATSTPLGPTTPDPASGHGLTTARSRTDHVDVAAVHPRQRQALVERPLHGGTGHEGHHLRRLGLGVDVAADLAPGLALLDAVGHHRAEHRGPLDEVLVGDVALLQVLGLEHHVAGHEAPLGLVAVGCLDHARQALEPTVAHELQERCLAAPIAFLDHGEE